MSKINFESAVLLTPGASSYITTNPESDWGYQLNLTTSADNRSHVAQDTFTTERHTAALFAGGHPGVQQWPEERIPPIGEREADLLAVPLETRLREEGLTEEEIAQLVQKQGDSTSTIGDIALSMKIGYLNPDAFHRDSGSHGIDLVAGLIHGIRIAMILEVALDIPPDLIRRVPTHDEWSTPKTEFGGRQWAATAIPLQIGGILLTKNALKGVKRGNADALLEADEALNKRISRDS